MFARALRKNLELNTSKGSTRGFVSNKIFGPAIMEGMVANMGSGILVVVFREEANKSWVGSSHRFMIKKSESKRPSKRNFNS